MDKNIIDISLMLLRAVLWEGNETLSKQEQHYILNEDLFPLSREQWSEVVEFFARQSLDGLLPDAVALLPADKQPLMAVKMPMIARQLQVERMNHTMNGELLAFTEELNRRDIPYVVFKGQGVATLYPKPQHRVCGDIDLYVPMSRFKEVGRGFTAFGATRTAETRHHVNFCANGVEWELHHNIYYFQKDSRNHLFMRYVDEAMRKTPVYATIGEGRVRVMPPTMNVLLLLSHIVDHFYCEGVGLRQLCDYALLLHRYRNDIDQEQLAEYLKALSLSRSYRVFGYICMHYLGMPKDVVPTQLSRKDIRLAHQVMADCLSGGNFGQAESNHRLTLLQNITFYTRFMRRLWRHRQLCPSEALWWPIAKLWRAITGTVQLSEDKSAMKG